MSGLEIALIIFGIIIFIGIIIVIILVAVGIFATKKVENLLSGTFSIYTLKDSSKHVTTTGATATPGAGDTLVVTSLNTIKCQFYGWTFKDNFLELENTNLVATVDSSNTGTEIKLRNKGPATDLNQWEYSEAGSTWCLKSNKNLCMFDNSDKLTLERISLNPGFSFIPVETLKSPACT